MPSNDRAAIDALRARLFASGKQAAVRPRRGSFRGRSSATAPRRPWTPFKQASDAGNPIAVAFLDMRMPPGPDGAWAAERIRELDPEIEIVICTAYSDVDPAEIGRRVPPADKLFYLQKPFHPHEVRQLALALGEKRPSADQTAAQVTDFDVLTGLPSRTRFMAHLKEAVAEARVNGHELASCTSISTTSAASTTRSGWSPAMSCCGSWRSSCANPLRRDDVVSRAPGNSARSRTMSPASAAISSWCCCTRSPIRKDAAVVAERLTRPLVAATPLANRSLS